MNRLTTTTLFPYAPSLHFRRTGERPECPICFETDKKILFCVRDSFLAHRVSSTRNSHAYHYFHKTCLSRWLKTDKDYCPLCQQVFTGMSIQRTLTTTRLDRLERGAHHAELVAKTALRGAYWGVWSWMAVNGQLPLLFRNTRKAVFFSCTLPPVAKGIRLLWDFRPQLAFLIPISTAGSFLYPLLLPQEESAEAYLFRFRNAPIINTEELMKAFFIILCFLSPDGYSPARILFENTGPQGDDAIQFFDYLSKLTYRKSRQAVPFLVTLTAAHLVMSRILDSLTSFPFPIP